MTSLTGGRASFSVQRRMPVRLADETRIQKPTPTRRRHSLLWRLSVIDISVLVVIVLLLAFTPVTIHAPLKPVEGAILFAGFVVIGTANLLLLRRAVAPLNQLSKVMRSIDPIARNAGQRGRYARRRARSPRRVLQRDAREAGDRAPPERAAGPVGAGG
jgi:hypothetical protein